MLDNDPHKTKEILKTTQAVLAMKSSDSGAQVDIKLASDSIDIETDNLIDIDNIISKRDLSLEITSSTPSALSQEVYTYIYVLI
jgi:hypothetical protein